MGQPPAGGHVFSLWEHEIGNSFSHKPEVGQPRSLASDYTLTTEMRLYVCMSVRLSVKRVKCDKTEYKSVQIFTPYERTFSLVFWEKEWLVGNEPFYMYLKFWVKPTALETNKIAAFEAIFARSAPAVTPSET